MTLFQLAGAASVVSAIAFVFAFLTWRRALARRALILLLGAAVVFFALSGAAHSWLALSAATACAFVIIPLVLSEQQQRQLNPSTG